MKCSSVGQAKESAAVASALRYWLPKVIQALDTKKSHLFDLKPIAKNKTTAKTKTSS